MYIHICIYISWGLIIIFELAMRINMWSRIHRYTGATDHPISQPELRSFHIPKGISDHIWIYTYHIYIHIHMYPQSNTADYMFE